MGAAALVTSSARLEAADDSNLIRSGRHFIRLPDQLPASAFSSFSKVTQLEESGWINLVRKDSQTWETGTGQPRAQPEWRLDRDEDGQQYARAHFKPSKHVFMDKAVMINERKFPAIPYYHSLNDSSYFESCNVSEDLCLIPFHSLHALCKGACLITSDSVRFRLPLP